MSCTATATFYECGICGHIHPWEWDGDCRDDANRLTLNELDDQYGENGYELRSMADRLAADLGRTRGGNVSG